MKIKNLKLSSIVIISAAVLVFYGGTVKLSESSFTCGYCHTPQHDRWAESTHKNIDCVKCHIDPGIGRAFKAQKMVVHDLYAAITKGNQLKPHVDPIPISTENCKGCHEGILYISEFGWEDLPDNSILKTLGLKMAHRTHIEKNNMDCVDCHRGVVHRNPDDVGTYDRNWPFMYNDCGVCHNNRENERFDKKLFSVEDGEACINCHPYLEQPPVFGETAIIKK